MKLFLKILLLSIVVISYTNCSRRTPRHTSNGRRVSQEVKTTQPNPHQSNNAVQVTPVTSKKVDKTKPNIEQIKQDLVGHSLSEGVDEGYYPSYWRWTIREGEISFFCIERIGEDSFTEYELISRMRLTSRAGKSFDAKVRLCYVFSETQGWNLQFVQSQGMHVVKTGKYNDCIKIEKDQFFSYFVNDCDITLEIGGVHYCWVTPARQEWEKFSVIVEPHGRHKMLYDFQIDYVEIP